MVIDEDVARTFFSCTTCGTCDEICPLPILEIVKNMREDIASLRPELVPENNKKRNDNIRSTFNIFGAPNRNRAKWAEALESAPKGLHHLLRWLLLVVSAAGFSTVGR